MIKFIYYLLKYKRYCKKHMFCGRCLNCKFHDDSFVWNEHYRESWANQCKLRKSLAIYFFDWLPCSWKFDEILGNFKEEDK